MKIDMFCKHCNKQFDTINDYELARYKYDLCYDCQLLEYHARLPQIIGGMSQDDKNNLVNILCIMHRASRCEEVK